MAVHEYRGLRAHVGHRLVCVGYGAATEPANVAVECETCHVVLIDFERENDDADESSE